MNNLSKNNIFFVKIKFITVQLCLELTKLLLEGFFSENWKRLSLTII